MMKKCICVLLTVISIIFLFSGCKNTYKPIEVTENYTESKNVVFKTEFEEYSQDVKVIKYSWTNISDETLNWGVDVSLVMFKDHEWQTVHGKDYNFQYGYAIVEPGDTVTSELDLEERFFLPLEPGLYCLLSGEYFSEDFVIVEN